MSTQEARSDTRHGAGPLAGIRVLDLTRVLAGPFSTLVLGDLGAEVIKVEHPAKGDPSRYSGPKLGGESTHFLTANRNKKSIAIDLKHPEGQAIMRGLAADADVLIANFRPGVLERLGLSYEQLAEVNPRLIVCSISGFGDTGPLRDRPSFDAVTQAMTGAMAVTGEPEGGPVRLGVALGDLGGGLFGAIAILAALSERATTGRGGPIDISLYDAMISLMHYYFTDYFATGQEPGRVGSGNPNLFPYGAFPVADGFVVIAAFQPAFWKRLCGVLGRDDLIKDPRFATNDLRVQNKVELTEILVPILKEKTRTEWSELLDGADIPNAPILSVGEVAEHPHSQARDMFEEVVHPLAGKLRITGRPIKFPGRQPPPLQPAPLLGEHTAAVLDELLSYPADKIAELVDQKVISLTGQANEA